MGETVGLNTNSNYYLQQLLLQQQLASGQISNANYNPSMFGTNTITPQIDYTLLGSTSAAQPTATIAPTPAATPTPAPAEASKPKEKKMGFLDGVGHFFKGAAKAIGGAVCSIIPGASVAAKALGWKDAPSFSIKNALIAAGTVALCIVCPPAGVAIAAVGVAAGTVKVGKGVYELATADTKEEQEAACEEMGAGTLEVGLSVAGAKAGLKSCGNTSAALSEEGVSVLTKAKNVGSGMLKDTGESLTRNTGKLGVNISENLKDTTGITAKAKAIKNGVVDTAKETKLYKNIKGTEETEGLGLFKGAKTTLDDTISDLKATGYDKVNEANNKLVDDAIKDVDDTISKDAATAKAKGKAEVTETAQQKVYKEQLNSLKEKSFKTSKDVEKFIKELKKSNSTSETKLSNSQLKDIENLANKLQKNQAKISKYDAKNSDKKSKILNAEKTIKDLKQASKDLEDPELYDLSNPVVRAKIAQEQASIPKQIADQEAIINGTKITKQGNLLTGAKTKVSNWAKNTLEGNAKAAAEKYNETAPKGMAIEPNGKVTKADIKATNEEITKIENEIKKAKEEVSNAKEAGKEAAETKLTSAQKKLRDLKTKLGIQEDLYNTASMQEGTSTLSQRISALNGSVTPTLVSNISDNQYTASADTSGLYAAGTPTTTTSAGMTQLPYSDIPLTGFVDNADGSYQLA